MTPNQSQNLSESIIHDIGKILTEDPNIFNENPLVGVAARAVGSAVASKVTGDTIDSLTDDEEPDDLAEGHHHLRKTSRSAEKRINRANGRAAKASGLPNFQHLDKARNELLGEIEKQRPLRRSEFINRYGYEAWVEYTRKHGLPENHKWADAKQ